MTPLEELRARWLARWEDALACWSRYTRLSAPRICLSKAEARRERLTTSFAMIRLTDHAVVIDLETILERKLEGHALAVLAHEIGHHVYCPGDLRDHARALARMRSALPTREHLAPFVANLYEDLLINDRLQRSAGVDLVGVYRALGIAEVADPAWWVYLRTYEVLWSLARGTLAAEIDVRVERGARLEGDAQLAARVIRVYARDWIRGAGRFAALMLPHLLEGDGATSRQRMAIWQDTESIGDGGEIDGMSDVEEGEDDVVHPAEDPEITGERGGGIGADARSRGVIKRTPSHRGPVAYGELLRAAGAQIGDEDAAIRYYEEQARRHLVPFPVREGARASDPVPEGLEIWQPGSALERIDWTGTLTRSPIVFPGLTTVERAYGESPGGEPAWVPVDLYVGIDCSGSMGNPRIAHSHAIVAGAVLALSALRAGARVKVVLSGEPGRTIATPGFERSRRTVMQMLTSYLGTGTGFGVHRLGETFGSGWPRHARPAHVLIVTDADVFGLLDSRDGAGRDGWVVAREALARARGGGTYVLRLPKGFENAHTKRMREEGWDVHRVIDLEELVVFARAFARSRYHRRAA